MSTTDEQRLRELARAVFNKLDEGDGEAPGHTHSRKGIWDNDNGAKAGTTCQWCQLWNDFGAALASLAEAAPAGEPLTEDGLTALMDEHLWTTGTDVEGKGRCARAILAAAPPAAQAEPVAWADDGALGQVRVVSAQTKLGMPRAASEAYTMPLVHAQSAKPSQAAQELAPPPDRLVTALQEWLDIRRSDALAKLAALQGQPGPATPAGEPLTEALNAGAMEAFDARWRALGNHLSRVSEWKIEEFRAWFLDGWAHALAASPKPDTPAPSVETEPVAWRWFAYGQWRFAAVKPDFCEAEPLFAVPLPPLPEAEGK